VKFPAIVAGDVPGRTAEVVLNSQLPATFIPCGGGFDCRPEDDPEPTFEDLIPPPHPQKASRIKGNETRAKFFMQTFLYINPYRSIWEAMNGLDPENYTVWRKDGPLHFRQPWSLRVANDRTGIPSVAFLLFLTGCDRKSSLRFSQKVERCECSVRPDLRRLSLEKHSA